MKTITIALALSLVVGALGFWAGRGSVKYSSNTEAPSVSASSSSESTTANTASAARKKVASGSGEKAGAAKDPVAELEAVIQNLMAGGTTRLPRDWYRWIEAIPASEASRLIALGGG